MLQGGGDAWGFVAGYAQFGASGKASDPLECGAHFVRWRYLLMPEKYFWNPEVESPAGAGWSGAPRGQFYRGNWVRTPLSLRASSGHRLREFLEGSESSSGACS